MSLSQSYRRILEPRAAPDFGLYVRGKRQPFLSNKKRPSFWYKVQQKLNNESLKKYFNFVSSTKYDFSLKMDYFSLIYVYNPNLFLFNLIYNPNLFLKSFIENSTFFKQLLSNIKILLSNKDISMSPVVFYFQLELRSRLLLILTFEI